MTLFPEWESRYPPPKQRQRGALPKDTPTQQWVLQALQSGPKSDRELHEWLLTFITDPKVGRTTMQSTERAVDALARRGLVTDRGDRGRWTFKGREIIWHLADAQEETA